MGGSTLSLPFDRHRLRTWRELRGYRQIDLAQRCTELGTPVSLDQVFRAETGRSKPKPRVLLAFAKALEIEVTELLAADLGLQVAVREEPSQD